MAITQIQIICRICSQSIQREATEVNRNARLGRPTYCSRACAGRGNLKNIPPGTRRWDHLDPAVRRDEYSPFRTALRIARKRSIEKEREFNLTLTYLKEVWEEQKGICPYTGWQMYLPKTSTEYNQRCSEENPTKASIDRIDSTQGYVIGNVQFVSYMANLAKSSYSHETMLEFCQAVVQRWRSE